MAVHRLECDYLVIGAGASGMCFVDELLYSSKDTTFIIVDKFDQPGGHWVHAYDFVTLHQPARSYGVKSKKLLEEDENKLATGAEILAYYKDVMEGFLSSGRVQFFPQCNYDKESGVFKSLLDSTVEYHVEVMKKVVDAGYNGTYCNIPSQKKPEFRVGSSANVIPVNGLPSALGLWESYIIIGGGKTSMDAIIHLIDNHVNPERIHWIIPNDHWMINREKLLCFMNDSDTILGTSTYTDLLRKWEEKEFLFRIDRNVEPKAFRGSQVSECELRKLQSLRNIVRQGRVDLVEVNEIVFTNGSRLEIKNKTLCVDCSATGEISGKVKPIWNKNTITIQRVQHSILYSAICIAAIEQRYPNEEGRKNKLLYPVPSHRTMEEFIVSLKQRHFNGKAVVNELGFFWMRGNRLNLASPRSVLDYPRGIINRFLHETKMLNAIERIASTVETN